MRVIVFYYFSNAALVNGGVISAEVNASYQTRRLLLTSDWGLDSILTITQDTKCCVSYIWCQQREKAKGSNLSSLSK